MSNLDVIKITIKKNSYYSAITNDANNDNSSLLNNGVLLNMATMHSLDSKFDVANGLVSIATHISILNSKPNIQKLFTGVSYWVLGRPRGYPLSTNDIITRFQLFSSPREIRTMRNKRLKMNF